VKGSGNQQDYGMRIYDPRLGKFLSVDPLTKQYPELTPFQFGSNNPIWNIDLDGLEGVPYTDPKQMLYQAGADLSQAMGRAWDKFTGFFVSYKIENDVEITKTKSILTTTEKTVDVGGNMESWIKDGRSSSSNTMPKLKFTNFFDVKVNLETMVEHKTKVETGNVKFESKINISDGSVTEKLSVKIPLNPVTKIPLKVTGMVGHNNTTNSTKTKVDVKTDSKPIAFGASLEVQMKNDGSTYGKLGVLATYEKVVGKLTQTSTLTVAKKF
jgi:hypothetical protein